MQYGLPYLAHMEGRQRKHGTGLVVRRMRVLFHVIFCF
jgi:hypothetical protein